MNKPTGSQVVRGVTGFISWLNASTGPLNSQRSDHSRERSLTPHHFMHSLIQEHILYSTALHRRLTDSKGYLKKPGTTSLQSLFLICSQACGKGGYFLNKQDKGLSLKAAVMGATFHALWFPQWSLYRQSQPSAQPQA